MKLTARLALVALLALAGAGFAVVLLMHHHGEQATESICSGDEGESGCDIVNRSPYSSVAGVPWAMLGMTFYLSAAALTGIALFRKPPVPKETRTDATEPEIPETPAADLQRSAGALLFVMFAAGIGLDLYLFAIQHFKIQHYCKLCISTYVINIVAITLLFPLRRDLGGVRRLLQPEGRGMIIAWALATVAFLFGAGWTEQALAAREADRAANILGRPMAAAPASTSTSTSTAQAATDEPGPVQVAANAVPAGTSSAGGSTSSSGGAKSEDLKAAQDEIKRLKEIMDDPQKYEQYQHEKSLKDFSTGTAVQYNITDSPVLGPKEAKIKVVEYADFLCPFCRNLAMGIHNYLPTTDNRVAVYYKFYPLDNTCSTAVPRAVHPGACVLAMGGVCAMKQGKFGPYHDKVVTTEFKDAPTNADAIKIAGDLGLSVPMFTSCLNAPETKARVVADITEGAKNGVTGTPSIFINGHKLPRIQEFVDAIDQESRKLGMGPMPTPPPPPGAPPQK
jgi:protein-disulfide isomerase/uncharacterized membrane protein